MNNLALNFTGNVKKTAIIFGLAIMALFGLSTVGSNKAEASYIDTNFNYGYDIGTQSMKMTAKINSTTIIGIEAWERLDNEINIVISNKYGGKSAISGYDLIVEANTGKWVEVFSSSTVSLTVGTAHCQVFNKVIPNGTPMRVSFKARGTNTTYVSHFTKK